MRDSLPPLPPFCDAVIRNALREDLGRAGDITTAAILPEAQAITAQVVAREKGCVAGLALARATFRSIDPAIEFQAYVSDGDVVESETVLATIHGGCHAILGAERSALNFLGHLSGIATATRSMVDAIDGTHARIVCTRKTTPGLRALEKYAVRAGGGINHRFGLDDAILIKDNHLVLAGSIASAIANARRASGHLVKVEVEVETLDHLALALDAGADAILLDNMTLDTLSDAVSFVDGRIPTEASGRIRPDSVRAVAQTGVDLISVGWITHSAPCLDLGLDIDLATKDLSRSTPRS